MTAPILVTGATGRLGRLITDGLVAANQPVRVFTRQPDTAGRLFGAGVQVAQGDFADPASVAAALVGVEKLLLLSPLGECLTTQQIAIAHAAVSAGVKRIVKISGSDWTIDPPGRSIAGDAHSAVEWHLRALSVEHVNIRPNAMMQSALPELIKQAEAGRLLTPLHGNARVAYVDARDVADVAVDQLLTRQMAGKPLVLTGSEAITVRQIAGALARHLHRPVGVADTRTVSPLLGQSFEHRAIAEFVALIAAGRAAYTTSAITHVLGRAPRTVEQYLAVHFAQAAPADQALGPAPLANRAAVDAGPTYLGPRAVPASPQDARAAPRIVSYS